MHDPDISDIDRVAYVDGQLDERRRLAIENSLSQDPRAAAEMMADLARRTALKLAIGAGTREPSAALEALARTRPAALKTKGVQWHRFAAMAAVLVTGILLGTGPDARRVASLMTGSPDYLDDAIQSREASLVRTSMASRPIMPWMEPADIRSAIRIRLPVLPAGWRLVDVQVYPSDEGPSAQLLIDTGANGQVSLFSSLTEGDETFQPVVVDRLGETMAFWEIQGQSFVLIGDQSRPDLRDMALDLSDNRLL